MWLVSLALAYTCKIGDDVMAVNPVYNCGPRCNTEGASRARIADTRGDQAKLVWYGDATQTRARWLHWTEMSLLSGNTCNQGISGNTSQGGLGGADGSSVVLAVFLWLGCCAAFAALMYSMIVQGAKTKNCNSNNSVDFMQRTATLVRQNSLDKVGFKFIREKTTLARQKSIDVLGRNKVEKFVEDDVESGRQKRTKKRSVPEGTPAQHDPAVNKALPPGTGAAKTTLEYRLDGYVERPISAELHRQSPRPASPRMPPGEHGSHDQSLQQIRPSPRGH